MQKLLVLVIVILILTPLHTVLAVHTSVEMINSVPTICADGQPYNIGGWTVATLGGIWHLSVEQIKQRMDSTKFQGFEIVEIFVPWQMVEWNRNQFWWEKIDSLMNYAENIDMYVLIQITGTMAPPWFGDTLYPDAVFYTFDPDSQQHSGQMWGRLAIPGEGSIPIFYHPGYYERVDTFFTEVINRYKNHPGLFGWILCLWFTGEYNYPGAGYGIAGFADYSSFTENLYGITPPYPLNMFSQPNPDTRNEWLDWTRFRVEKKREVLYHFAPLVKSLDPNHILIGYPGGGLWGEWDNGYIGEVTGGDYTSMLADSNIDVIRGAPQVSRDFLDIVNNETSPIPYMMIGNVQDSYKNGKPYLLQCERSCDTISLVLKIKTWAEFHKSLGCDLIWWEEPDTNNISGLWLPEEKIAIGNTKGISDLPKIVGFTAHDFAFIDLPFECNKYYSDNTYSLMFAMKQVKAFLDAGLPFDCISEDEILQNSSILNDYNGIGLLFPDMYNLLATDSLKNIIGNYPGVIWNGSPLAGYNYYQSGYTDTMFLDSLKVFYDTNNLARHHYDGHFIYIVGNKPYIFILSRESGYSGTIGMSVKGWNLPDGDTTFMEYNSGESYTATISGNVATLNVNLIPQEPYLFILKPFFGIREQGKGSSPYFSRLFQNKPNPFNLKTSIRYLLTRASYVELNVYNIAGQLVKTLVNEQQEAGTYSVAWNSKDDKDKVLPSGIYFVRLKVGDFSQTKKMLLLR